MKSRERPRWQSRKTLSSLPLMSTPKSHLSGEQPSMKKTRTYQEIPTNKGKRNHNEMRVGRVGKTGDIIKSHPPGVGNPQTGE